MSEATKETKDYAEVVTITKEQLIENLSKFIDDAIDRKDRLITIRFQRLDNGLVTLDQIGVKQNSVGYGTMNTFKLED